MMIGPAVPWKNRGGLRLISTHFVAAMLLTFCGTAAEAQSHHASDTSQDWVIDDFELLDYIDLWAANQVDDFDLLDCIDL